MKIKWIGASLILFMMAASPLLADSVYFWTDENGVRHYSNTGIPPGVQDADERPEEISASPAPETDASTANESASEPPPEEWSGDTPQEKEAGEESEQEMDKRMADRVEKERQRLEAEIKRIRGLGIGKSFTPGMKDAMIRPLEEQLALLNADPERYFRMKREGAFDNASGGGSGGNSPGAGGPLSDSLESREGLSATSQSADEGTASPEANETPQPTDQASSEDENSGGARSSEPGASLRLPEE